MNLDTRATRPRLSLSERKRRRDRWGWAMIGISAFLLAGLFVGGFFSESAPGTNLCKAPEKQIIIVVDQTDPFDPVGKSTIKNRINNLIQKTVEETKKGEKISLFSFTGRDENRFPPVAQACSPGSWDEHNHWLSNQKRVTENYKKFSEGFAQPIERVTTNLFFGEAPIIEAIADIGTREEFIQSRAGNRMILVSDMIQNSQLVKFYDYKNKKAIDLSDEELVKAIQSIMGDRGLDLGNFNIEVYELFHEQHPTASDEVRKIWERLLKARVKTITWKWI